MSADRWTPGPWKIVPSGGGVFDIKTTGRDAAAKGKGTHHVARVIFADDARLVAAAPELFDALDRLFAWADRNHQIPPKIHDAALAAIRKVEGP